MWHFKKGFSGTLAVLVQWLGIMILKVFSNLNKLYDSVIQWVPLFPLICLCVCWGQKNKEDFMGITCASCHSSHCPMSPASTCRRRCTGQTPLLPQSCCGSTLSIQSNFIPDLAFWGPGFLGHSRTSWEGAVYEETKSLLECFRKWKAGDSCWGPQSSRVEYWAQQVSLPLSCGKIQFGN